MEKPKRFSLMPAKSPSADTLDTHHRRVASADAEPNGSFGSHLDVESRNAPSGELQPLLTLVHAHSRKVYFSGYLAQRTVKSADGKPLKTGDSRSELQGVYVKLIGNVLNVWIRRDMEEAAATGGAVPPKYINIADGYAEIVGSILVSVPPPEYQRTVDHVFTLNYAGLNKQEYVAGDEQTLHRVVTAIRLSAWEKKRLEELYTGHLLRILQKSNLPGNSGRQPFIEPRSPLAKGKMEGWVKVRFGGTAKWQRYWLVLTNYRPSERKRSFFGGGSSTINTTASTNPSTLPVNSFPTPPNQSAIASFYTQKNPKSSTKPIYTLTLATQAYAIFPERTELISHSGLMKVEGIMQNNNESSTMAQIAGLREDGWCLMMPDLSEKMSSNSAWSEMVKWLVGIHDCFNLYGRPQAYSFDPRDPKSLFFSYPIGPQRMRLFLDLDLAAHADVYESRSWAIRANLLGILRERMLPPASKKQPSSSGTLRSRMSGETASNRPLSLQPGGLQSSPSRLMSPPSIPSTINRSPLLGERNVSAQSAQTAQTAQSGRNTTDERAKESEDGTLYAENQSYRSYKSNNNPNNGNLHIDTSSPSLPPIAPLDAIGEHVVSGSDRDDGETAADMHNVGSKSTNATVTQPEPSTQAHAQTFKEGLDQRWGEVRDNRDKHDNHDNHESTVRTPLSSLSGSLQTPGSVATGSVEEQTARAAQELRRKLSLGSTNEGHAPAQSRQSVNSAAFDQHVIPYPVATPYSEEVPSVQSIQSAHNEGSIASKYSQNTYNDYAQSSEYETEEEEEQQRGDERGASDQYLTQPPHDASYDNDRTPHVPTRPPPLLAHAAVPAAPAPKPASLQAGSPVSPTGLSEGVARSNTSYSSPRSLNHSASRSSAGHTRSLSQTTNNVLQSPLGREGSVYSPQSHVHPQAQMSPAHGMASPPQPMPGVMPQMGMQMPMGMMPGMPGMSGAPGAPPMDPNMMGNQAAFFQAMMAAQQAFQQSMWQFHTQAQSQSQQMQGSPSQSNNAAMSPSQNMMSQMPMSPQSQYSQYSQMSPQSPYAHFSPSPQTHQLSPATNGAHSNSQSYQSFYTHSPQN